MSDRHLDSLSPRFKPLACELLARCTEAQIPVLIVNTRRTPEEQRQNIANGVSWTKNSKHLTGDAIDIVPFALYTIAPGGDKLQWDAKDPIWQTIGPIGEALGLRWGGRWTVRDMTHFEFVDAPPRPVTA